MKKYLQSPENLFESFSLAWDVSSRSINESLPLPSEIRALQENICLRDKIKTFKMHVDYTVGTA